MLSVIRSFHDGMLAQVRVGGDCTTNSIEVKNGGRQGCTLAPSLFNIYFSAMIACWRTAEAGVTVRYRHSRKLVGDRTAKSLLSEVRITESLDVAKTWSIKAESVRRLSGFHNHCIRTIMGVTKQRQWREHISSRQLAADFGMEEMMAEF